MNCGKEQVSELKQKSLRIELCLLALLLAAAYSVLLASNPALADPLPSDLIPPDVTLSPKSSTASRSASSSSSTGNGNGSSAQSNQNAPGLGGGGLGRASYGGAGAGARLPATGIGGGASPQPPPAGSGANPMFTGISTPPNPQAQNQSQAQGQGQGQDPVCVIDTNKGRITIRLFKEYAPKTVDAFISMISEGFYNGLTFHRHEPGFVIQGGCPKGNGTGLYIDPKTNQPRMLLLETSQNVRHNAAGVVAMAHFPKNPHSASCQFYITLAPQQRLDFKYTIFGGVIDGMDTVFKITKGDKINSITMQN